MRGRFGALFFTGFGIFVWQYGRHIDLKSLKTIGASIAVLELPWFLLAWWAKTPKNRPGTIVLYSTGAMSIFFCTLLIGLISSSSKVDLIDSSDSMDFAVGVMIALTVVEIFLKLLILLLPSLEKSTEKKIQSRSH